MFAGALVIGLAIEAVAGWPKPLYEAIGHPVGWFGRAVNWADATYNRESDSTGTRRRNGALAVLALVGAVYLAGSVVQGLLPGGFTGALIGGLLVWPLIAARSLHDHVAAVAKALRRDDLPEARRAVSLIVGRETATLDRAGVARAGIESLAENTSDGIIAPLFWGLLLGLPGIAAYKAINTLDSMVGHRSPRHEAFGWAAARLDDLVNLIPARLTALLFALASGEAKRAWATVRDDARKHRSPNAGWPEAAMAGALGIRLSGPRVYADRVADEPWVNASGRDPGAVEMGEALGLYRVSMISVAVALLVIGWL